MLTEIIDLPSKGNLYPKDHPLADGKVEIKYMTAREEDILTTQSYIQEGIVTDKLLENVIISDEINPLDLSVGDKERVLLETRILGYGSDYEFRYRGNKHTVDLSKMENKGKPDLFNNSPFVEYKLPQTQKIVTIKIQNGHDSKKIQEELKALRDTNSPIGLVSLRLSYLIHAIDGDENEEKIRDFAKNIPAKDSMELRSYVDEISPDVDLSTMIGGEEVDIPMGANFFYPSTKV